MVTQINHAPDTSTIGLDIGINPNESTDATEFQNLIITGLPRYGEVINRQRDDSISTARQNFKGTETGRTSGVEFNSYLKLSAFRTLIGGMMYTRGVNTNVSGIRVSNVTNADGYAIGDLNATQVANLPVGRIMYAVGFTNEANNGFKVVTTQPTVGSNKSLQVGNLVNESSTEGYLFMAGRSVTGLTTSYSSLMETVTLNATGIGLDPAVERGSRIRIGIPDADGNLSFALGTGTGQNAMPNSVWGRGRVVGKSTDSITLDQIDDTLKTNNASSTNPVYLRFGELYKNRYVDDTTNFHETWYTFQRHIGDQGPMGEQKYLYALQNRPNTMNIPLNPGALMTMDATFEGRRSTGEIDQRSGLTTHKPIFTDNFSPSLHVHHLRSFHDKDGLYAVILNGGVNIDNQVTRLEAPGYRGSAFLPFGNFLASAPLRVTYSDPNISDFINSDADLSYDSSVANGDGAIDWDIPAYTFDPEGVTYERGNKVILPGTASGHLSKLFDTTLMVNLNFGPTYEE